MEAARRVIAHLDVDAFYASVELQRRPDLAGKPVVVAGSGPRAVVTTASYEARRFGIDSAMPAARARGLCPQAVFLTPDFDAYRRKSDEVWQIVRDRLEVVQQVGIDEAYVDLTGLEKPLRLLRELVAHVRVRTGMVVSVGVGPSRLVAKTASAAFKPAAFFAIGREEACRRFASSPARALQGVGPKTAERLARLGIANDRRPPDSPRRGARAPLRGAPRRLPQGACPLSRRLPARDRPRGEVALERDDLPRRRG